MRKLKLFSLFLLLLIGVGQVWGTTTTLFQETWGSYTGAVSSYTFTGTTASGGTTGLSYSVDNNNDVVESNTAGSISTNNLFFYKKAASSLTISGINLQGAKNLTLSFKTNGTNFAVYYKIGTGAEQQVCSNCSTGANSKTITLTTSGTMTLRFNKTGTNNNNRLDDIVLTTEDDISGGGSNNPTVLSVPTGMSSGTPGMTSATLSWNPVEHADGYALTIGTNDPITTGFETVNNKITYTLSDLDPETTYTWKVKATTTDTEHYSNSADCAAQEFETAADPNLLKVVFDFTKTSDYPSEFPTASGTSTSSATEFTFGSNTLVLYAPNNYYRDGSHLFFGKTATSNNVPTGAYIEFPARSNYKLTKVVLHENSGAANGASLNIWSTTNVAMSTAILSTNVKDEDATFVLTGSEYNKAYRITAATADKNLRFDKITLTYAPKPEVSSISIKTAPTKKTYTANEHFDPSGLVITVNYEGGGSEDVAYNNTTASDFTFSPTTSTALNAANSSVTVTYGAKTANQAITVNRIATTLSWSPTSYTVNYGSSYTFPTLTKTPNNLSGVTYSSSNTNVATINANTGAISVVGTGSTTITAAFAQTNVYAAATPATYTLTINAASSPSLEVDPNSLTFPLTAVGGSSELKFDLYGYYLTADATLVISGVNANMFSVVESVDKDASDEIAETITITYAPTAASVGSHMATLTITSGTASASVTLSGTAKNRRTVTWYKADNTELTAAELGSATPEVWDGDAVTVLPNGTALSSCDPAISFQGWTNATYAKSDAAPTVLFTDAEDAPEISGGNASYYAVWANASGSAGSVEINTSVEGYPTNYTTANTFDDLTVSEIDFKIQQICKNNSDNSVMQWRALANQNGTGTIYNNKAFPGHISSVVVVFTNSDANKNHTLKIGDSANPTSGTAITPTSNGNTYTFDCSAYNFDYFVLANGSNAGYTSSVTINYAASIKDYSTTCSEPVVIADPAFSPAAGSYNEDQNVTITAEDGMTIYYSIGAESNPKTSGTTYSSAIPVTEDKTIKAVATDGSGNWSNVVTKTYTINYSSSIAAFIEKAQNTTRYLRLNAAQNCVVTAVKKNYQDKVTNIYCQDNSGAGIIIYNGAGFGDNEINVGDRIVGAVSGTWSPYLMQPEMGSAVFADGTTFTAVSRPAAPTVEVEDVNDGDAYTAHPMMLVTVENLYYKSVNESAYTFNTQANGEGTDITIYDNFSYLSGKTMPGVACTIVGIMARNNNNYQILPVELTTAEPAALPTISPEGGADSEHAVEVTYLSTVSVLLEENEDIYVSVNDAEATKLTEAASIQIENDTKITVTAKRDFHADNAITYFYKPSSYPKNISVTSTHGEVVVKVNQTTVSTALPGTPVTFTVTPENEHFHITSTSVTYEGGSLTPSLSENVYSFMMPDKDATIVVSYSEDDKYSISFAKNGASGDDPTGFGSQYYAGTPITLPNCPYTYDDMKFTGWVVTYGESISVPQSEGGFSMPAGDVTITAQWAAKQYCALTLRVNGEDQTPFNVERLVDYDLSDHNPAAVNGYTFYGWAELDEDVEDDVTVAPTVLANHIFTPAANEESKKLYAVFKHAESVDTKDVLTAADLTATGSGYTDFSGVSKTSDAVYAGSSALDGGENIQLRSKNSNSGIVSTTSGGIIKSVKITVAKGSNTVDVYGSNSAYTDATSLFGNSQGTNIGGTSETATITPTAQQVFEYVGIRSNDGAIYLSSVEITWTNSTYTYTTIPATLYDVTYTLGEGEWSGDGCPDTQVKDGMGYTICSENPVRDGFKFVEWQVGGVAASGEITISGNTEIVAVWTPKAKSALTYAPGEGSGDQQTTSNVEEGTVITLPSIGTGEGQINFSKAGYKFVGWNDGTDTYASGASFTMPAQDATLTAQWEEGSDFTWVASEQEYEAGAKITTASESPIAIVFAKAAGSNDPAFYTDAIRMYKANTVTIATAADDQLIKSIVFTFDNASDNSLSGNGLSVDGATGTWSGLAKTLTFINNTEGSAKAYVEAITVTYANGTVTTLQIAPINLKTSDENATAIVPVCNLDPVPTINYSGYDTDLITIENGTVAHKGVIGNTTVTATIVQGSNYLAATTTFTVTVSELTMPEMSFPEASYNAYLGSDFVEPVLTTVPDGLTVKYNSSVGTVATVNENTGEISLVGEGQTVITASFAGNDDYATNSASYTLNVIDPYKDVLTASAIGVSGSYAAWKDKSFTSAVVYAGNSTTGTSDNAGAIQMRTNNSNSGIVVTSSIGYLKALSATRNNNAGTLEVYAKSNAYESAADLYDANKQGTLIGTITTGAMSFEDGKAYADNYKYIGIKSASGAVYYDDITIEWTPAVFASFDVTYQAGEGTGTDVVESIEEGSLISLKAANTFTAPEGKMFAGWLLEGEENAREAGSKYTVTAAVTFVAQWINVYTITYLPGEADGEPVVVENVPVGNYSLAAANTFEAPASKEFAGWLLEGEEDVREAASNYTVSGDASFTAQWSIIKQPAGLAYATTSYMITRGRSFEAPELTNQYNLTVTYSGNNDEVATVDAATGAITLQGGIGTVTVTATSAETDYYYAGEASYTLKVKDANLSGGWVRLTNANTLVAGMKVIVAQYVSSGTAIDAMGGQTKNNRAKVAGTLQNDMLISDEGTEILTLVAIKNTPNFALKTADNKYLYAASSSDNYLKSQTKVDDNAKWAIELSEDGKAIITAQGDNTRKIMRYNNNNKVFSCYASGQQDIALYSKTIAVSEGDVNASTLEEYADVVVTEGATLVIDNAAANKPLGNITVSEGATVTVSETVQANDMTVEAGGILDIAEDKTTEVNNLYISSQSGASAQVTHADQIEATGVFMDVKLCDANPLDANYWYCIAVPFDVNLNDGVFQIDGTPMVNRQDFEVWGYNTELRAQTQSNGWQRVSDNMMHAGKAYLIGFNEGQANTIRLKATDDWKDNMFSGTSMSVTKTAETDVAGDHDNWNGLANPTMEYIDVDANTSVFDNNDHTWNPYALDAVRYNFVVGTAFFVQSASAVTISNTDHGLYRAPKRVDETKCAYAVRITREDAKDFDNQIIVRASEDATGEYTQGHDMLTMNGTSSNTAALLWTENYGGKRLAIEEAAWLNGTASYVLKMFAPAAGTYSISVAEAKANADLYLTYEGNIIWNLSESAYPIDLKKGTTEGYGLLLNAKAPGAATGVDNIDASEAAQKVIINDHVYILRNGQMYDVNGKAVK